MVAPRSDLERLVGIPYLMPAMLALFGPEWLRILAPDGPAWLDVALWYGTAPACLVAMFLATFGVGRLSGGERFAYATISFLGAARMCLLHTFVLIMRDF
ncbi:MAG: hypothetical protein AAGD14_02050 [Planctomycetota bacterium]